ncbi:MAG: hypothetical protein H0W83_06080 [Planctomycetes bacterium]|nr:hypothetical protein [Planctomycetota bacterium]
MTANRTTLLLTALVPSVAIAAMLITVMVWREGSVLTEAQANLRLAQQQQDEIRRAGTLLTLARTEAKEWKERWQKDSERLTADLAKAAADMTASHEALTRAQADLAERDKHIADLESQLKAATEKDPK